MIISVVFNLGRVLFFRLEIKTLFINNVMHSEVIRSLDSLKCFHIFHIFHIFPHFWISLKFETRLLKHGDLDQTSEI